MHKSSAPQLPAVSLMPQENKQYLPDCTIVIPTYNEAANVKPLLQRLKSAFAKSKRVEVLFVDDSPGQATARAVRKEERIATDGHFSIRLVHRKGKEKWGGLGGAVTDGISEAKSPMVIVMDGDLQHPPELAPELLKGLDAYDIAVASRYAPGGSAGGLNSPLRHLASKGSTKLAKILFPKALKNVSDPLTGFFALRRDKIELDRLKPNGFKILLEILARHPRLNAVEIPLQFAERAAGDSKATLSQGIAYLEHLLRLKRAAIWSGIKSPPRTVRFGLVGGGVFLLGFALLFILVEFLGVAPIPANGIQLSVTFLLNYMLNRRFTWGDRLIGSYAATKFVISRGMTSLLSFLLFALLVSVQIPIAISGFEYIVSVHYLVANVITLLMAMVANYLISDRWVFRNSISPARQRSNKVTFGLASLKYVFGLALYILLLRSLFDGGGFWAALLATVSIVLFAQASMEVWRMLYSYREPDAVDKMKFPEPGGLNENFCLIVPARHEEEVLQSTLEHLDKQEHPRLTILSVVCHDDPETLAVARAAAKNSERITVLEYTRPEGVKPSKPLQLNYALEWMKRKGFTAVGVFDAEDTVHPELLLHIDAAFRDEETQVVQGGVQLMNYDRRWFTLHNVLEYWKWFSSVMQFQSNQRFVPLGGNTVFVRYDLLEEVGGWPLSLTEDCALGVLLSARYKAKTTTYYDARLATREEAPETIHGLFFQRVRWMQGFYHEWLKCVWKELPTRRQRFIAIYVLANPTLQSFAALMIPISLMTIIGLKAPVGLVMIMYLPMVPLVLQLLLNVVYLHDFGKAFSVKIRIRDYVNLLVMHFPYQIVLNWAALWALVREVRGENSWHKTKHSGAHRTTVKQQMLATEEAA